MEKFPAIGGGKFTVNEQKNGSDDNNTPALGNGGSGVFDITSLIGDTGQIAAYKKYLTERATLFLAYKALEYDNLGFVLSHTRGIYPNSKIIAEDDDNEYYFKFGNIDTSYADMKEVLRYYDLGMDEIIRALLEHVNGTVPITPFGFCRLFESSGVTTVEITEFEKEVTVDDEEFIIKEGYYGECYRRIEVLVDKVNELPDVGKYGYYEYDDDAYILSLVIQAICAMEIGHGCVSLSIHPEKELRRVKSDTPYAVSISSLAKSVYWFFKEQKNYILVPEMNTNIQLDVIYAVVMEHGLHLLGDFQQSLVRVRLSLTLCGQRLLDGGDPKARVDIRVNECLKLKKIGQRDPDIISKEYLDNFGHYSDRSLKDEVVKFLQDVIIRREDLLVIEGDASRMIYEELSSIGYNSNGVRKIIPLESVGYTFLENGWETRRFDYWETVIKPLTGRLVCVCSSQIGIGDLYRRYRDMFHSLESFSKDCEIFFLSDGCVDIEELTYYGVKLKKRGFSIYPLNYWGDTTLFSSYVIRKTKDEGYEFNFKDAAARIDRFVHKQHIEFLYRYLSFINYATCNIGFMMVNNHYIGKFGPKLKITWRCEDYDLGVATPYGVEEKEKLPMTIDYG